MAIGTSLGQWFPDRISQATQKFQSQDNNELDPDLEGNAPTRGDKIFTDPMTKTSDFMYEAGYKSAIPFPDNHNPDMDFNNRFRGPDSTGTLTPEDMGKLNLSRQGVDDRRDQGSLSDQFSSQMQALKQWGHNTIHPDAPETIPGSTPLAEELGYSSIKAGDEKDRAFSFADPIINDVLRSGKITGRMIDAIQEWRNPTQNITKADQELNFTPQERDLYQRHLYNLNNPTGVDNPDGSRSTLYQAVQEHEGKYYNIPTVWNGKIETEKYTTPESKEMDVPNKKALENVEYRGWDKFPSYNTPEEADSRYEAMHKWMEKDTSEFLANRSAP